MNQGPNETSMDTTGDDTPFNQDSSSSFAAECPLNYQTQSDIPTKSVENPQMDQLSTMREAFEYMTIDSEEPQIIKKSGLEISFTEESEVKSLKENEPETEKSIEYTPSSEIEAMDISKDKYLLSSDLTSKVLYAPNDGHVRHDTGCFIAHGSEKDSCEDTEAKALKLEYENRYAREYSKELLFAVDVMTLVRHLNNLECKWIIYDTNGNPPASQYDEILDDALRRLWSNIKDSQLPETETDFNYKSFQKMVLMVADKFEARKYYEKYFLLYCLVLAQLAVCAEKNGLPEAIYFVPLVICRTIQNLKDSKKLDSSFWEKIAEEALNITRRP